MSPARRHRERHAALAAAAPSSTPADLSKEGGAPSPIMTPARAHLMRHAALKASVTVSKVEARPPVEQIVEGLQAAADGVSDAFAARRPASTAEAQIALRLTSDLRTLKAIHSIARKIEAKRIMLPEYRAWIGGVLDAVAAGNPPMASGDGGAGDVLPTIMVWLIDTGDYAEAMPLIEAVLAHKIALPARYDRIAPAFIVEEIADAAIKAQAMNTRFDLDLLLHLEELTADCDMHDQVRAKLEKAIGEELFVLAGEQEPGSEGFVPAHEAALAKLKAAYGHNDRVGVKDRIKRAEKALAAVTTPTQEQAGSAG